ncbi:MULTISPECIES: hypothetical protein [Kitasatospora]|nr:MULTISPECIES: hypothetical protein [Kitasatospora]
MPTAHALDPRQVADGYGGSPDPRFLPRPGQSSSAGAGTPP